MNVAVVVFPGTNCERDVQTVLRGLGAVAELVWHRVTDLSGFDAAVLPGGFAHGDYLRTGAIARFSPVMSEIERMAAEGRPVLGICNGFQILCEAGLLPGSLIQNQSLRFLCRPVAVRVASTNSVLTAAAREGDILELPLNSYEGNYTGLTTNEEGAIVLQYGSANGDIGPEWNPNGSTAGAAAVSNRRGNVVGVMPHPERASDPQLGSDDGLVLWESFLAAGETADV